MADFAGLVAIVTGGSGGIGAATTALLLQRGARVAALDRDLTAPPEGAFTVACDVTDAGSVDRAVAAVHAEFGGVDVVVNNAGIGAVGDVAANDDADWARVHHVQEGIRVNAVAPAPPTPPGSAGSWTPRRTRPPPARPCEPASPSAGW
jgi:NADP-dependent 3-hydroxy acid dehydrogenase YdfG